MPWGFPSTAKSSSWTQGPQGVRQQEAQQPRVDQAPNSEGKGPEATEETLGESQLVEEAEEPSPRADPDEKSSGQLPSVCPSVGHYDPSGFQEPLLWGPNLLTSPLEHSMRAFSTVHVGRPSKCLRHAIVLGSIDQGPTVLALHVARGH